MTANNPAHLRLTGRRHFLLACAGSASAVFSPLGSSTWVGQEPPRHRRVWLRLLLNQVAEDTKVGKPIAEQKRFLAGLTNVKYVYLDEAHGDVILEGPAEDSWQIRPDGLVLGDKTAKPLLQLDDFAVAWRNANGSNPPPSVSLDHRKESMEAVQRVIRGTKQPTTAEARAEYTRRLQEAWGPQDAITGGVPTSTRFNRIMIDADWEMKRLSLGLTDAGVGEFPTYIDLEFDDLRRRVLAEGLNARKPDGGSRFWFYPAYTEFAHSEKRDAIEIPSDPVQLLTESHFRNIAQGRQVVREPSPAAKQFVEGFTRKYAELAAENPLFAELRNLFDWVAVARLILQIDAPRRVGWDLGYLARGYPVGELDVPTTMPGQVALRHAEVKIAQGTVSLVFPARGGISIDVDRSFGQDHFRVDRPLGQRARRAIVDRPTGSRFWRSLDGAAG